MRFFTPQLNWLIRYSEYGLRALGRHWYKMLRNWFVEHGFNEESNR